MYFCTIMRKLFFILLVFALVGPATAQKYRADKKDRDVVAVGIKGGVNLAQFQYDQDLLELNKQEFDGYKSRLNPMFGLSVEIPMLKGVVFVSPEVLFDVRGDSRMYESSTMRFQAKVNYLEARLPIAIALPVSNSFKPYVFAAPSFGYRLPSFGSFESKFWKSPVNSDTDGVAIDTTNMAAYDYGVLLGAGLRFKFRLPGFAILLKVEGGYYYGLCNTFSKTWTSNQLPTQDPTAFDIEFNRLNRGFEAAITIAVPLDFHSQDDCFYWSEIEKKKNKSRGYFGF